MSSTLTDLTKARELLTPPRAWTQGAYHTLRGRRGREYHCFCAMGAIRAAVHDDYASIDAAARALIKLGGLPPPDYCQLPATTVVDWNDKLDRTKRQVLAAFDKAIKKLAA